MDAIHKRYVTYAGQSLTQRDTSKTDYTYAKSYSYRRGMNISMMYDWPVPNMCRISLNSVRAAIKISDKFSAISKVSAPSNQFVSVLIKSLNFGDFSLINPKTEELLAEVYVAENHKNERSLKSKQLKSFKRKADKSVSMVSFLLFLIFFSAIILLFWWLWSSNSAVSPVNQLKSSQFESQYMFCYSVEKPDPKPKLGVLQFVSTISKEGLNTYTSLYRFKETDSDCVDNY